jgi:hypothetical protein
MDKQTKDILKVSLIVGGLYLGVKALRQIGQGEPDANQESNLNFCSRINWDNTTIDRAAAKDIGLRTFEELSDLFTDRDAIIRMWTNVQTVDDVYSIICETGIRTKPWYHPNYGTGNLMYWFGRMFTDGEEVNELLNEKGIPFNFPLYKF